MDSIQFRLRELAGEVETSAYASALLLEAAKEIDLQRVEIDHQLVEIEDLLDLYEPDCFGEDDDE